MIDKDKYKTIPQCVQPAVSGSFSDMEAKWLLCYGEESRESKVKLDNEGRIDYQIEQMFNLLEEHTIWKRKEIEELFWNRITAIANYR